MGRLFTENLEVSYGERKIVKGLSLSIPDKKITAIIGPNGCGKSTFLKAMTRVIPHDSGSVILDGQQIAEEKQSNSRKSSPFCRSRRKTLPV